MKKQYFLILFLSIMAFQYIYSQKTYTEIAVVLSGCGYKDGAEIQEAVSVLIAICKFNARYTVFAPNIEQNIVVNHLTREPVKEKRNVLVESARIARGEIKDLKEYNPDEFDALVIPGGNGNTMNLSSYNSDGFEMKINPYVESAIKLTHKKNKPIGALCIAPVLIAKLITKSTVTIGNDERIVNSIKIMGSNHKNSKNTEVVTDYANKIVTTPCYMLCTNAYEVYEGAETLIQKVIELTKK